MKNNMKLTDYYKSGQHKKNALAAASKGKEAQYQNKLKRVQEYNNNPCLCVECNTPISYEYKNNKFCSKSCAARHNNRKRAESGWSQTPNQRNIAKDLALKRIANGDSRTFNGRSRFCKIVKFECKVCHTVKFVSIQNRSKTCGNKDCIIQASVGVRTYQNGSRKPQWFFNPFENKDVLLESSWEVDIAKTLVEKNIEWIRPPFIKYMDKSTNKLRRYFPDFYLPKYNIYLDPKNPYCMNRDINKMLAVSELVNIIYGDLDKIKYYINELV